jgi:hypothetical protein
MAPEIKVSWPRCEFIDLNKEQGDPKPCGALARWSNDIGGGCSFWCGKHMMEVSAIEENRGVEFNELDWKGRS